MTMLIGDVVVPPPLEDLVQEIERLGRMRRQAEKCRDAAGKLDSNTAMHLARQEQLVLRLAQHRHA